MEDTIRIETKEEVETYLARLKYALKNDSQIEIQLVREVDKQRDIKYTNRYTIADLFPDEKPEDAIRRELQTLTVANYLRTRKDIRFPKKSEMREFGKVYHGDRDVYIKLRVELTAMNGSHFTFVMSFHYAEIPFSEENFPYA